MNPYTTRVAAAVCCLLTVLIMLLAAAAPRRQPVIVQPAPLPTQAPGAMTETNAEPDDAVRP